jgi:hypothetical protein
MPMEWIDKKTGKFKKKSNGSAWWKIFGFFILVLIIGMIADGTCSQEYFDPNEEPPGRHW